MLKKKSSVTNFVLQIRREIYKSYGPEIKIDLPVKSLDPLSFRESRIENRLSSIELRETVNLHLNGTAAQFLSGHFLLVGCGEGPSKW